MCTAVALETAVPAAKVMGICYVCGVKAGEKEIVARCKTHNYNLCRQHSDSHGDCNEKCYQTFDDKNYFW